MFESLGLSTELTSRLSPSTVEPLAHALVAYSGGLDSLLCVALARKLYRAGRITVAIGDVGQGEGIIDTAIWRLRGLEVDEVVRLNLAADFFGDWLPRAIAAHASYRGYPIAAPMVKQILGRRLGELAILRGCDGVVEGTSGVGNDQFRFATSLAMFAPDIRQVSPLRDFGLSRIDEIVLCDALALDYEPRLALGGDDVTPWCRSIASGAFGLDTPIASELLMWVAPGAQKRERIALSFVNGLPVALDGRELGLGALLDELNPRLGACGIGMIDSIEDNRLGAKGREIYEAPAATAILTAKAEIEYLCLTREELTALPAWRQTWLHMVYDGRAYHPLVDALDAAIAVSQRRVCGTVELEAFAGALRVVARHSPDSAMAATPRLARDRGRFEPAVQGCLELERLMFQELAHHVRR